MEMHTHFRPRPVDINVQLPIITDPKEIEKIEQEGGQHSFTPIKSKRKRKSEVFEEEEEPIATVDDNKVPIPSIKEVPIDSKSKKEQYKRPKGYINYKEKTEDQLFKTVEYDLDSEDEDFLSSWKVKDTKKKKKDTLSEDQLESLLDLFEKKSSQKRMPPDELEFFQTYFHLPEGTPCCICGEHEVLEDNPIVYCDGCNIAVHQYCYGISKAPNPEATWLCRKCENKAGNVKCIFCPVDSGAFKPTSDGRWGHVVCALWIPELSFKNKEAMEPITQISKISSAKWNQPCCVCNQRYGVCVECSEKGCKEKYHLLCGREMGFILTTQQTKNSDLRFLSYCRKHSMPRELDRETPTFGFKKLTPTQIQKLSSIIQSERKLKLNPETIETVFHFWQLKRKHHPRSLLRRLQYLERGVKFVARNNITDDEYHSRFINLRRDFEKVRLLLDLLRKRENLKRDHTKTLEDLVLTAISERRRLGPPKDVKNRDKKPIVVEDEEEDDDEEVIEDKSEDEIEIEDLSPPSPPPSKAVPNGKHKKSKSPTSTKKNSKNEKQSKNNEKKSNSKNKHYSEPEEEESDKEEEEQEIEEDQEEEEEESDKEESEQEESEQEEEEEESDKEEEEVIPIKKKYQYKKSSRSLPPKANGKSKNTKKRRKQS